MKRFLILVVGLVSWSSAIAQSPDAGDVVTLTWPQLGDYKPFLLVIDEQRARLADSTLIDPIHDYSRCNGSPQRLQEACLYRGLRIFEVQGDYEQAILGLEPGRKYGVGVYYLIEEYGEGAGVLAETYIKVRRRKGPQTIAVLK